MTSTEPSLLRPALLLAAVHLLLSVVVFLLWGLGLEGPTIGGKILFVLGQPLLSVPGLAAAPPALQNSLIPVNSLLWGVALASGLRMPDFDPSFGGARFGDGGVDELPPVRLDQIV